MLFKHATLAKYCIMRSKRAPRKALHAIPRHIVCEIDDVNTEAIDFWGEDYYVVHNPTEDGLYHWTDCVQQEEQCIDWYSAPDDVYMIEIVIMP